MRLVLATMLVAGCSFEHGNVVDQPDGGDLVADPTVDAEATLRTCRYADPELRLCIEFDDRVYSPVATDTSPYHHDANASQVQEVERSGMPAAQVDLTSTLVVPESAMLDIKKAITFETWVTVPSNLGATLIGNLGQYALTLGTDGRATCWIGNLTATSAALGTNTWRHLACAFDGEVLRLYVDGAVQRCQSGKRDIPMNGTQGTRLASSLVGAIDDIRIYARALAAGEICTHADKTGCSATCPGSSGPGGSFD